MLLLIALSFTAVAKSTSPRPISVADNPLRTKDAVRHAGGNRVRSSVDTGNGNDGSVFGFHKTASQLLASVASNEIARTATRKRKKRSFIKPLAGVADCVTLRAGISRTKRQQLAKPQPLDGQTVGKWAKEHLTWAVVAYENDALPFEMLRQAIAKAASTWAAVTPLTFSEVSEDADVLISICDGTNTGCTLPFNSNARTYYTASNGPYNMTKSYFNANKKWFYSETRQYRGKDQHNLLRSAIHELGHVLDLAHSYSVPEYQTTIMYGVEQNPPGIGQPVDLAEDDIQRIQALYGLPRRSNENIDSSNDNIGSENGDSNSNENSNQNDNGNENAENNNNNSDDNNERSSSDNHDNMKNNVSVNDSNDYNNNNKNHSRSIFY